jgi:ferredoxin
VYEKKNALTVNSAKCAAKRGVACARRKATKAGDVNVDQASPTESTWPGRRRESMNKVPDIDRWECTDCESCINLLPDIFKRNEETGCIEVAEVTDYPEEEIQRVMSMCPGHCIAWQQP